MRLIPLTVVALIVALSLSSPRAQSSPILYAPLVGAVTATSLTVAVRAPSAASVRVRYKRDIDSLYQDSASVVPSAATDWAVQIPLAGLEPSRRYDYRVVVDGQTVEPYQTRTFPAVDTAPTLNLALLSDHDSLTAINDPGKPLDVYPQVLGRQPDLLVQLGDFPHWNPAIYPVQPAVLENWRLMQRTILAEALPVGLSTWTPPLDQDPDDHDAAKNDASLATKPAWRAMLLQAHDETYPSYPRPNPSEGLWQTYRVGRHVQVIKLDVRSQKDPKHTLPEPVGHTMLGLTQKAWLKSTLLASTATWKIILTPLAWQLSIDKLDSWYGYQNDRDELTAYIVAHGIRNVLLVSGDNHCGFLDDGTNSGFPEINIPGTNTVGGCSSGFPGYGSHGVLSKPGLLPAGAFAWLTVDAVGQATAQMIRADGVVLFTMPLAPQ